MTGNKHTRPNQCVPGPHRHKDVITLITHTLGECKSQLVWKLNSKNMRTTKSFGVFVILSIWSSHCVIISWSFLDVSTKFKKRNRNLQVAAESVLVCRVVLKTVEWNRMFEAQCSAGVWRPWACTKVVVKLMLSVDDGAWGHSQSFWRVTASTTCTQCPWVWLSESRLPKTANSYVGFCTSTCESLWINAFLLCK